MRNRRWCLVLLLVIGSLISTGTTAGADGNEAPGAPAGFRQLSASADRHVCAVLDDGRVKCWGRNANGQLGLGDTESRGDEPGEMGTDLPAVDLGAGRTATAVAAGTQHSCALLDNGQVKCWGGNAAGQLGLGDTQQRGDGPNEMGANLPTVDLGAGRTALAITAGAFHTCAVLDDVTVRCWGDGAEGALGLGDQVDRGDNANEMGANLPVVPLGASPAVVLSAAGRFTCALLANSTVKCWGAGFPGNLGLGDGFDHGDDPDEMGADLPAVDLGTGRTALAVTAGQGFTCALLDNHQVKCWGDGDQGRLGQGSTSLLGDGPNEMGDALPAIALGTGRTADAITAGSAFACALLDDGTVKCWGLNTSGQLGQGDESSRGDGPGEMGNNLPAVSLGSGAHVDVLTAGGSFACVVLSTGARKCWGGNDFGQLGLSDTEDRGDEPGEMGDNLPVVDLDGAAPTPTCDGHVVTVDLSQAEVPTAGDDVILGTGVGETINGLGGNDRICGGGGIDTINGGPGNDRLFGDAGNDKVNGGDGLDVLTGGEGNDTITGGNQNDTVNAGNGSDEVQGQNGNDTLNGQAGTEDLQGGAGNDRLNGGSQRDTCNGGPQADTQTGCEVRTSIP